MIFRPQLRDIKNIGDCMGKIILGFGMTMFLPFVAGAALFKEFNPAFDFIISAEVAIVIGLLLSWFCQTTVRELDTSQALVAVALSWLAAMVLGALPLFLSGHYNSFLDSCFEMMSSLTTTGLTLIQDLDHLSRTHNLWRHMGAFIGGQGIAIVAISFLAGGSGVLKIYIGEARDEKLMPNVIHTARVIWIISLIYLIIGVVILGYIGISFGLRPPSAFFHAVCIFMAGFDTAGFAPQSQNILYYHSMAFEVTTIIFMILGSLNFNLHYQIWKGNYREIWKNIESRTLLFVVMFFSVIIIATLKHFGVYSGAITLFRKVFYHVISGHTTTGYMAIYAQQFIKEWGSAALNWLIFAMALGGCTCSTAGGIKILRIGIIYKALREDMKKMLLPAKAVIKDSFHHISTIFLSDKQVRVVLTMTLSYLLLYVLGTMIGIMSGYPLQDSLFESVSAAANVGLSCGVTDAAMPAILKITYIIEMWAGRLELVSVFALIGFLVSFVKGK